jgi:serine/threonine protein kinase
VGAEPSESFGQYLVYEQLGVGGMAQVHRAAVTGIEGFSRPVALKRMLEHLASNEEAVKAFVREARLASYMRHRNIAQTYELGKVGDIYFIAMELVTGHTLREVLKHCGATTGPMPVPVALNILNQICDALDYAHNLADESGQRLGIIHRDVSPSNIIVAEGGVVKLIDFGIAKASAAGMQTMSGTIKGKFGYMAPEYLSGSLDARADLFAVGVIAHELLTNRPLFSGPDELETMNRVLKMEVLPPSHFNAQVPPEIDDIVMTALQRDPEKRWQHATALRTALTTLTQRLGLVVQDAQVIEWIAWALEQTKPRQPSLRSPQVPPSLRIDAVPTPATDLGLDQMPTIIQLDSHEPEPDPHDDVETVAMVTEDSVGDGYPRHDALHPTGGRLVPDEIVPTVPRLPVLPRPAPQPELPPMGAVHAAPPPNAAPTRRGARVTVLLVLLAAAATGAGVYLAL